MLSGGNLQCSNCLSSCQTCGYYYDDCQSCNSSQNRYLDDGSCVCNAGYYDTGAVDNICVLCSSALTECYNCTNGTVCIECNENYFLFTSGGATECEVCNAKCETCSITSTNCTSCNNVSYNRVLSGNTCACESGYVEIGGSTPCLSCDSLNDGCTGCVN